jgi:hypothetical protein
MVPERPGSKINCIADYRPVLSSERPTQYRTLQLSDKEDKRKNVIMGPTVDVVPKAWGHN